MNRKTGFISFVLILAFSLGACGSSSSNDPGPSASSPLTLAGDVTTFIGTAGMSGSTDGTGAAARLSGPTGITSDGTNLYVADQANSTIRQVVIATGVTTTLAGTAGITGSTDGTGAAARFNEPFGVTTDGTNVYVADLLNSTIRQVVIATGVTTTLAGTAGMTGSTDGTGAAARFNNPIGITTDGTNLYVSEEFNHTVRKIVIATGVVTTLAGTAGMSGSTDGTGAAARFMNPWAITTSSGSLYVSDTFNHTVRKIVIATGVVTTLAGTAGMAGNVDGIGAAARFNYPTGITCDGTNLYLADALGNTIRKVVIATGEVTTLAGTAGMSGSTDGNGAAALFNQPVGVTDDGTSLFISDRFNNTVRQID